MSATSRSGKRARSVKHRKCQVGPSRLKSSRGSSDVSQVVIVDTRWLKAIAESKQKTDRHDAKTLAQLLAARMLAAR
jgi:hypothetical protein